MIRFWPDGLAARMMLLLAAALTAALVAALAVLAIQRETGGQAARLEGELGRLIALVPAIEEAGPAARARLIRRAGWRGARLRLTDRPGPVGATPQTARLAARLSEALDGRDVRVAEMGRRSPSGPSGPSGPPGQPGGIAVSIDLAPPSGWLRAELDGRNLRRERGAALPWILLLLFGAVLGAGLLIARQVGRPLAALEVAARAAGRGDRTARVASDGPRELRHLAEAFNEMQVRLARTEAERARVLGALGHDLRTPITGLRIRAEMLPEADGAPMIATLDEMAVMADGLLAEARGAADPEAAGPVDLADLLSQLAETRGAAVGRLDAVTVRARPVGLRRAVGNLIDNALRYGGTATLSLTADDGHAVIAVEDDGPGIPEAQRRALQDPFVRGDTARGTDGSGLGLSIARSVARAHGGTLELSNRAGGGLRAEIRLPRTP